MDFKFSKDQEDSSNKAVEGSKGNQNVLLIILLVLVGGFAYLYFFTGLIKPLKQQKPAEAQAPQVIKNPIPPRNGEPVKVGAAASPEIKKEAPVPSAGKPELPKVAQVPPAAAPAAKEAPKPKEAAKKPETAKPALKQPMPVQVDKQEQKPAVAKGNDKKTAQVEKKPTVAVEKKDAVKKTGEKLKTAGGEAKATKKVAKPEKKPAAGTGQIPGGRWTVTVGSYLLEDALARDLVRVRQAGLEASVTPGTRKKTEMNRLFLGEYSDRSAAQAELDKIKRHTSDAFIMGHGGKHAVYAGSYLLNERAISEKERLAAAGFSLTIKRTEVAIPSKTLTAGTFSDRKAADSAIKKLKAAGVKATLSQH